MPVFITDRTEADVLLGTTRGRYTFEDLNRVERAVQELADIASNLGLDIEVTTKLDWGAPGAFDTARWPTESQMVRYLSNVHRLADLVSAGAGLPLSMVSLNWEGANHIEAALQLTYTRLRGIIQAWRYSGELYAGEE